jgi:hypothetical protein
MKLSYLFECHFKDGTVIQQNEADVSSVDPGRSAFYDVMQRKDDIVVFGLYTNVTEGGNTYAVDLRDGSFIINGAKFLIPKDIYTPVLTTATEASIQNIPFEAAEDQKYELLFFRRHKHMVVMGQDTADDLSHQIEYHLGWTTKVDGKEIQQTISIS